MSGVWNGAKKHERGGGMKRLWQWVFNVAAAVSFLFFVATVVLWLHSHYVARTARGGFLKQSIQTSRHDIDLASGSGRFQIDISPQPDRWAEQASGAAVQDIVRWWVNGPFYDLSVFNRAADDGISPHGEAIRISPPS